MEKTNIATDETTLIITAFSSRVKIILESTDINKLYNVMMEKIKKNLASFNAKRSNWIFKSIVKMEININKYQPFNRSLWIDLS